MEIAGCGWNSGHQNGDMGVPRAEFAAAPNTYARSGFNAAKAHPRKPRDKENTSRKLCRIFDMTDIEIGKAYLEKSDFEEYFKCPTCGATKAPGKENRCQKAKCGSWQNKLAFYCVTRRVL